MFSLQLTVLHLILIFNLLNHCKSYITYIESKYPLQENSSPPGSPWPLPQIWTKNEYVFEIDAQNFSISSNTHNCAIVDDGLLRLSNLLNSIYKLSHKNSSYVPKLHSVSIEIENSNACNYIYPQMDDNEFYEISIPFQSSTNARIQSDTIWGALRGLETLSQLIYTDNKSNKLLVNATLISDWPRFSYRGVMLDTARHFLPKNVLLANLDAMSYNKFNVFHWHIVDDQSFPFESKIFPELSRHGSFSQKHIYSQEDIEEIIEFARFRGIRVVPEFDTPGHTQGFGKAFPHLLTPCYGDENIPFTAKYAKHASAEILNPIQNFTYDFMKAFFQEVRYVFQDDFVHMGMDEVYYDCWKSNPHILKFMKNNEMSNMSQVEQYYVRRMIQYIKDIGFKAIIWQDPIDNGVQLSNDTLVMVWKEKYRHHNSGSSSWKDSVSRIVKQGYNVVVSACWYLNYISYGEDWEKYYRCDPRKFQGTLKEKSMVLGGEACLWGEYVDGTNVLSRLWPRASAVAERLWSDPHQTDDINSARYRLDEQRCRMVRRGIPAQPILNGFCGDYEWEMDNNNNL